MHKLITSLQNPLVKEILQLQEKSRVRKKKELFVIEGYREITLAIDANYQITTLLFCKEIIASEKVHAIIHLNPSVEIIELSLEVYQKLAHRKTTEGILAISKFKSFLISDLKLYNNPLILVAEAPEKPGNLGALLRTADASNIDAVIIANPKTDVYNPNIIRSSVGCVFTNTIAIGSTEEIIEFLKGRKIQILCAALLKDSENYAKQNFTKPTAIIVGTEATGLSEAWLKNSDKNIIIPMQGKIDSLNVSVSAAILIFEAKRQRNFN